MTSFNFFRSGALNSQLQQRAEGTSGRNNTKLHETAFYSGAGNGMNGSVAFGSATTGRNSLCSPVNGFCIGGTGSLIANGHRTRGSSVLATMYEADNGTVDYCQGGQKDSAGAFRHSVAVTTTEKMEASSATWQTPNICCNSPNRWQTASLLLKGQRPSEFVATLWSRITRYSASSGGSSTPLPSSFSSSCGESSMDGGDVHFGIFAPPSANNRRRVMSSTVEDEAIARPLLNAASPAEVGIGQRCSTKNHRSSLTTIRENSVEVTAAAIGNTNNTFSSNSQQTQQFAEQQPICEQVQEVRTSPSKSSGFVQIVPTLTDGCNVATVEESEAKSKKRINKNDSNSNISAHRIDQHRQANTNGDKNCENDYNVNLGVERQHIEALEQLEDLLEGEEGSTLL